MNDSRSPTPRAGTHCDVARRFGRRTSQMFACAWVARWQQLTALLLGTLRYPLLPAGLLLAGSPLLAVLWGCQLNAALDAFRMIGVEPPTLISLAKQEEEIFRPGQSESIKLSRHSAALRLLQYVRDEAHRFAQHYHHILRRSRFRERDQ